MGSFSYAARPGRHRPSLHNRLAAIGADSARCPPRAAAPHGALDRAPGGTSNAPMPYKSLSSPRAQLDVGAEIRAAATLATPTVVAMVTSDPVRIGLVPASGSAKVCATQLGSAEAVALLGKDVALVQKGDEVWSLSDITHTARPEQVARDVRSLHGRPGGDSALVLGWDGSATQVSWGKDEASTRTFALRGDVRALWLDAVETFVVVAGGAGGELRFHPGATPEPGASGRCALPADAAPLDRIRGGRELAVLFTPGRREVCLVRRGGAEVVAKMVELEVAPVDLAVSESSFFTVFADGRAALYDNAAVVGTSEGGVIAPTSAVSTGARGAPMALAITGKQTPSLWVGTGAGEVLSLTVMRKTG
jgi:hypothetical protein